MIDQRALVVAGIVGLLTFLLALAFLAQLQDRAPLVVAARSLPPGTKLTMGDLEVRQVPHAARPTGALTRAEEALGRTVSYARAPGDAISEAVLGDRGLGLAAGLRPETLAVAVKVDQASGLGGILRPGDRVTAVGILGRDDGGVRVVLAGLRVLFVPQAFRNAEQEGPAALRTLAPQGVVVLEVSVTPLVVGEQMLSPLELLALLEAMGRVHLALEPSEAPPAPAVGVTVRAVQQFLGLDGGGQGAAP